MILTITEQVEQPVKGVFDPDLSHAVWRQCAVQQHPRGHVAVNFPKGSEEDAARPAELREISSGRIWIMTLQSGSAPTLYREKKKKTHPSRSGLMDAWIFFFFAVQFISFLLALPFCLGAPTETRDSNEISQTLHHVEFLMIILHFVDNQQNVLNQVFSA